MQKMMHGSIVGGGASGIIPLNGYRPRPERESAVSAAPLVDGPYNHVSIMNLRRIGVQVTVSGGDATVALEVTNGDPNDVATEWHSADATSALDGDPNAATDMLIITDNVYRYARVSWSSGAGTPDIAVEFFGAC